MFRDKDTQNENELSLTLKHTFEYNIFKQIFEYSLLEVDL